MGQGSQEEPSGGAEIGNRQKAAGAGFSANRDIRQIHQQCGKIGGSVPAETAARDCEGRLKGGIQTLLYRGCARIRYEKPIFAAELFAAGWDFREDWRFPFLLGNLPVLRVFTGLKALVSDDFFVWCAWQELRLQPGTPRVWRSTAPNSVQSVRSSTRDVPAVCCLVFICDFSGLTQC